jgi:hypothetical protein
MIFPDRELEEERKPGESEPPRIRCPRAAGPPARKTSGSAHAAWNGTPLIQVENPCYRQLSWTPAYNYFFLDEFFRFARRTVIEVFAWHKTEKSLRMT